MLRKTVFSKIQLLLFITIIIQSNLVLTQNNDESNSTNISNSTLNFPKTFIFSTASASYQIEGAWNESGKGENIWDRITHTNPSFIYEQQNGDIACDSYHKYKEDIQAIKYVGFEMYRFSMSWTRILPDGTLQEINRDGINYYHKVIDELVSNNIEPMITLYHWDLPQALQNYGGWMNASLVKYFEDYANLAFKEFGNKVKWWVTFNEPLNVVAGYAGDRMAPALNYTGRGDYIAAHNILKSHAKVYHLYNKVYKPVQRGKISMVTDAGYCYPLNKSSANDIQACERAIQFTLGWFAHPIYSESGDYPPVMREYVDRNSAKEHLNTSRLPYFTTEEIQEIKGTWDYFGLNHYTSAMGENGESGPNPSVERDANVIKSQDPKWPSSESPWLKVVPDGFRQLLNWIKVNYNNPPVFVTENGFSDFNQTQDDNRIKYYQSYLKSLNDAMIIDKCNVIGYTAWSIIDNFEWRAGYSQNFGLFQVDFNNPDRPRKKKASADYFKKLIAEQKEI